MTILVTGGAGYIGSHTVKLLGERGEKIVILDNLSTGHKAAILHGELVQGDLSDEGLLDDLFNKHKFEAIIHFAGSIIVPESVREPLNYYQNNTINSHRLIRMAEKHQVKKIIFSSTAAVYGMPESGVCVEGTPLNPMNPYGESKLMTEHMLRDQAYTKKLSYVALRYFNVAGADPDGKIGQSFPGATHLIKVAVETVCGKRKSMEVFGTDYPTPDGTCVRDFIHVTDLAAAHLLALDHLRKSDESLIVNCGYGHGHSVKQVIEMVKQVSGVDFEVKFSARREGDPAVVVANSDKIKKLFDWKPKHNDLSLIIKTALNWEKKRSY